MSLVEQSLATIQLLAIRLGLRPRLALAPLDGLLGRLEGRAGQRRLELGELDRAIDRAEGLIERLPGVGCSCLYRALGRFGLLSAWGYQPAFVMGIDPKDPNRAHAWLEVDGVPFREPSPSGLVVSFRFRAGSARRC